MSGHVVPPAPPSLHRFSMGELPLSSVFGACSITEDRASNQSVGPPSSLRTSRPVTDSQRNATPRSVPGLSPRLSVPLMCSGDKDPVDIGSAANAGDRYAGIMQDFVVVQELYTAAEIPKGASQAYVLAVCDGHGILGDKSACFAGKALTRSIYSSAMRSKQMSRSTAEEVQAEMRSAFRKAHIAACAVYDMPPKTVTYPVATGSSKLADYSLVDAGNGAKIYRSPKGSEKFLECGTTCTAVVMQGRRVCLANVGDSLAALGTPARDGGTEPVVQEVTVRHYGLLASEAERIRAEHHDTTALLEDGYIKVLEGTGPWEGYELAVTRALGHKCMESYGVIDTPHCVMLDVEPGACLVIASDGLWDVLTPREAVTQAMEARRQGKCAAAAAQELVQRAIATSAEQEEEQDNTTAVVVFFHAPTNGTVPPVAPQPQPVQHTFPKKDASCTRFAPPAY